jgi:hypothetical protein
MKENGKLERREGGNSLIEERRLAKRIKADENKSNPQVSLKIKVLREQTRVSASISCVV